MRYSSLVKMAVTDWASVIVTTQSPFAFVQAPLQPVKVEPVLAVAVRVMITFCSSASGMHYSSSYS